jgi:hypothetical protein
MINSVFYALLIYLLLLTACSQRTGYEIVRQVGYQECLKNSKHPAEDCKNSPDFDAYQQERNARDIQKSEPQ